MAAMAVRGLARETEAVRPKQIVPAYQRDAHGGYLEPFLPRPDERGEGVAVRRPREPERHSRASEDPSTPQRRSATQGSIGRPLQRHATFQSSHPLRSSTARGPERRRAARRTWGRLRRRRGQRRPRPGGRGSRHRHAARRRRTSRAARPRHLRTLCVTTQSCYILRLVLNVDVERSGTPVAAATRYRSTQDRPHTAIRE